MTQVLTLCGTQFKLWHEKFCFVKKSGALWKNWFKIWFFSKFPIQRMFSFKNIALRINLSEKEGNLKFDILTMYIEKKIFESKLSKKAWCLGTSFTWKSVTLLKFPFKTWCVVNRMFQNLTRCKISDTKNDELCKVHQKIVPFWKTWFESDSLLKTGFKIWFFSKILIGKLFFFPFLKTIVGFWENA